MYQYRSLLAAGWWQQQQTQLIMIGKHDILIEAAEPLDWRFWAQFCCIVTSSAIIMSAVEILGLKTGEIHDKTKQ